MPGLKRVSVAIKTPIIPIYILRILWRHSLQTAILCLAILQKGQMNFTSVLMQRW